MQEDTFWNVIAKLDWEETGDDDAVLEPAVTELVTLGAEQIYRFFDILAEKLHSLDTREHCRQCYLGELDPDDGHDYISADDFLYARCVVVANGREFFQDVLKNPSEMPRGLEFEALLSLAGTAYERLTGREFEHLAPVDYESFQNVAGWAPTAQTRPGTYTDEQIPPGNRRPT
jgi:hypothetical protein